MQSTNTGGTCRAPQSRLPSHLSPRVRSGEHLVLGGLTTMKATAPTRRSCMIVTAGLLQGPTRSPARASTSITTRTRRFLRARGRARRSGSTEQDGRGRPGAGSCSAPRRPAHVRRQLRAGPLPARHRAGRVRGLRARARGPGYHAADPARPDRAARHGAGAARPAEAGLEILGPPVSPRNETGRAEAPREPGVPAAIPPAGHVRRAEGLVQPADHRRDHLGELRHGAVPGVRQQLDPGVAAVAEDERVGLWDRGCRRPR